MRARKKYAAKRSLKILQKIIERALRACAFGRIRLSVRSGETAIHRILLYK